MSGDARPAPLDEWVVPLASASGIAHLAREHLYWGGKLDGVLTLCGRTFLDFEFVVDHETECLQCLA